MRCVDAQLGYPTCHTSNRTQHMTIFASVVSLGSAIVTLAYPERSKSPTDRSTYLEQPVNTGHGHEAHRESPRATR